VGPEDDCRGDRWQENAHLLRLDRRDLAHRSRTDRALGRARAQRRDGNDRDDPCRAATWAAGAEVEVPNVAASLTWLGERLSYLESIDLAPFDDESPLMETLTSIWMRTVYGRGGAVPLRSPY
jgi:hypothetical protein